jgi:hypothetical protein
MQILLLIYVYAAFLRAEHQSPGAEGFLALAAVLLTIIYFEFARKITRTPAAAERTYVRYMGLGGTAMAAVAAALLAAGLAIAVTRPWSPNSSAFGWGWLAIAPLAVPAAAGWRFWRKRLSRWPPMGALGYPLAAFTAFLLIGLLGNGHVL